MTRRGIRRPSTGSLGWIKAIRTVARRAPGPVNAAWLPGMEEGGMSDGSGLLCGDPGRSGRQRGGRRAAPAQAVRGAEGADVVIDAEFEVQTNKILTA